MRPFFRFDEHVGFAGRRPTLQEKRNQRKPGFVDKDDEPAVFTGFFLDETNGT
jgi:hypothetical protein